jgi:hypothetical protein
LPHLQKIRAAAQLLFDAASVADEAGLDYTRGQAAVDVGRMAAFLREEPILISWLVAISIENKAIELLFGSPDNLAKESDDVLAALSTSDAGDIRADFHRTLQGERCFGSFVFKKIIEDPRYFDKLGSGDVKGVNLPSFIRIPWFGRDYLVYMKLMSRTVDHSAVAFYEKLNGVTCADFMKTDLTAEIPSYAILTRMILPSIGRSFARTAEYEARVRMLAYASSIVNAFRATGKLGEAGIPLDPFTGKSMKTANEGDLVRIWSVGEDLSDDGGVAAKEDDDSSPGDIVLRFRLTPDSVETPVEPQ